ncbi:MAG: disulfide bond formation protein B [Burkholderiaceae bacterium]|jgi:disulfide bond formation protein DsbB|nr:disulfide bond formation protein B [Burkholderiaceae bacterium]
MSRSDRGLLAMNAQRIYGAVVAVVVALLAAALYFQHVKGLEPCPLCILQRYAFVAVGAAALLAALAGGRRWGIVAGAAALLAALAGAGTAARHVWIQLHPESLACGPGLATMIENFPLYEVLPKVFRGSGDCGVVDWSFLGLSMPAWALVWFALLALALGAALARR